MTRNSGFTLLEMLVVIVLLVVIIAVAVPDLRKAMDHYRAQSAIDTIQQYLAGARNQAISYSARITVCPLSGASCVNDWSRGLTMFIDSGNSNELDGNDQILQVTESFPEEDTVIYSRPAIRFLPTGLAAGTNGTFKYCPSSPDSKESMALVVNNAGRVRVSTDAISCQ